MPTRRPDDTRIRSGSILSPTGASPGTPSGSGGRRPSVLAPSDVRQGKYSKRYRRFLNLAQAAGFDGYPAGLFAALAVNQFNPEDYYTDEPLFVGRTTIVAAGGPPAEFAWASLFNPSGSNRLVVVDKVWVTATAADFIDLLWDNVQTGFAAGVQTFRDTRFNGPRVGAIGAGVVAGLNSPALPPGTVVGPWASAAIAVAGDKELDLSLIVAPGTNLLVGTRTAQAQVWTVTFWWRELVLPQ